MSTVIGKTDLMVFNNEHFMIEAREKSGNIEFKIDGISRSLGFTQIKNEKEYIKWERVNEYLSEFGFSPQVGKDDFIPEQYVYLLGMKAKNELAISFQKWLAFDVLPSVRKHGAYISENADVKYVNNELRFSKGRTIKTFSNTNVSNLKSLYSDFREYVDYEYKYKTDERLSRYKSVEKGLEILHDEVAKDISNIGDCYNIRKLKEQVLIDRTTLEKRISGGDKASQKRQIKGLNTEVEVLKVKVDDMDSQLKKSITVPDKNDFVTLNIHGMSNNYMYEKKDDKVVRTVTYNNWIRNFPKNKMPSKESWNINWNEPVEIFLNFVAKPKIDTDNLNKSIIDMIITKVYKENDNIVHDTHSKRVGTCEEFWNGSISFYIRNMKK